MCASRIASPFVAPATMGRAEGRISTGTNTKTQKHMCQSVSTPWVRVGRGGRWSRVRLPPPASDRDPAWGQGRLTSVTAHHLQARGVTPTSRNAGTHTHLSMHSSIGVADIEAPSIRSWDSELRSPGALYTMPVSLARGGSENWSSSGRPGRS